MADLSGLRRPRPVRGPSEPHPLGQPRPPARLESTLDGFTWEADLRVDPIVPWVGWASGVILAGVGVPAAALVGFVLAVVVGWIGPIHAGHLQFDLIMPGLVYLAICAGIGEIGRHAARTLAHRRAQVLITLTPVEFTVRRGAVVLASAPVGEVFVGVERAFVRVGPHAFTLHGVSAPELTWLDHALRAVTRDLGRGDEVPSALGRLRAPER